MEETMKAGRASLVIAMLAISLAGSTAAQTKPNVSGTWKMNRAKSTFANGGPEAITIKFDQQEQKLLETLTITNSGGDRTLNMTYVTDGKPGKNEFGGQEITTIASWEGPMLIIVFKREDGSFTRKFTMSADGKTMTIAVRQSRPQGDSDDTVFLEKQ
jgi:hypothetical protein